MFRALLFFDKLILDFLNPVALKDGSDTKACCFGDLGDGRATSIMGLSFPLSLLGAFRSILICCGFGWGWVSLLAICLLTLGMVADFTGISDFNYFFYSLCLNFEKLIRRLVLNKKLNMN